MNIAAIWERATLILMTRHGLFADYLDLDQVQMSSLRIVSEQNNHKKHRIVCVHGLGSSGSAYSGLLPHLSQYWSDVWAPSAPSHGMSPPLANQLKKGKNKQKDQKNTHSHIQAMIYQAWETSLLHLSKEKPIDLLGVSLGGAISIRFAARYPDRVSSLMLCSPAGALLDENDIEHLKKVFSMERLSDGLRFLKTLYHKVPWWGPLLGPFVQLNLKRPEAQALIQQLKPGDGLEKDEFTQIQAPTFMIWGMRERILPKTSLQKLLAVAPKHFELLQPPHFSHTPQKECPAQLAQCLIEFQKRIHTEQP